MLLSEEVGSAMRLGLTGSGSSEGTAVTAGLKPLYKTSIQNGPTFSQQKENIVRNIPKT